jgi:hypothetical protein
MKQDRQEFVLLGNNLFAQSRQYRNHPKAQEKPQEKSQEKTIAGPQSPGQQNAKGSPAQENILYAPDGDFITNELQGVIIQVPILTAMHQRFLIRKRNRVLQSQIGNNQGSGQHNKNKSGNEGSFEMLIKAITFDPEGDQCKPGGKGNNESTGWMNIYR